MRCAARMNARGVFPANIRLDDRIAGGPSTTRDFGNLWMRRSTSYRVHLPSCCAGWPAGTASSGAAAAGVLYRALGTAIDGATTLVHSALGRRSGIASDGVLQESGSTARRRYCPQFHAEVQLPHVDIAFRACYHVGTSNSDCLTVRYTSDGACSGSDWTVNMGARWHPIKSYALKQESHRWSLVCTPRNA